MALGESAVQIAPLESDTLLAQMVGFSQVEKEGKLLVLGLPTLEEWQGAERQQGLALVGQPQVASFVADRE
jgi:flagellar hook assembly protein FlgD